MPKGKELSSFEKGQIDVFNKESVPISEIANDPRCKDFIRSRTVVRYMAIGEPYHADTPQRALAQQGRAGGPESWILSHRRLQNRTTENEGGIAIYPHTNH